MFTGCDVVRITVWLLVSSVLC